MLNSGVSKGLETIEKELVAKVCDEIGPVAAFRLALTVVHLPKTHSGKILRATMKAIADGKSYSAAPTIEDLAVLEQIGESLRGAASEPDFPIENAVHDRGQASTRDRRPGG